HVIDVDRIVDARERPEPNDFAICAPRLHVDDRPWRELVQAADRERLLAGEAEARGVLTRLVLQREDAHPYEVRAMDALEGLRDDRPHAEEQRTLRRPVTRAARAVLLACEYDERRAIALVAHRCVVDHHLVA